MLRYGAEEVADGCAPLRLHINGLARLAGKDDFLFGLWSLVIHIDSAGCIPVHRWGEKNEFGHFQRWHNVGNTKPILKDQPHWQDVDVLFAFDLRCQRWLRVFQDEAGDFLGPLGDARGHGGTETHAIDHHTVWRDVEHSGYIVHGSHAVGVGFLLRGMSLPANAEALIVEGKHGGTQRVEGLECIDVFGQVGVAVGTEDHDNVRVRIRRRRRRGRWALDGAGGGNPPSIQLFDSFLSRVEAYVGNGQGSFRGDRRSAGRRLFGREKCKLPLPLIEEETDSQIKCDAGGSKDQQNCLDQPASADHFRMFELICVRGELIRISVAPRPGIA